MVNVSTILIILLLVSAAKKKRDGSPTAHYSTSGASTSKSRSHIPVSERQQFALLKLMETKNSPSDRGMPCSFLKTAKNCLKWSLRYYYAVNFALPLC